MIEDTLTGVIDWLTDRKDRFYGVVVGKVKEVVGDEMAISRVKVELPFIASDELSGWARVVVPMAGPSYGTYFIPNVDDDVLVAFEHGDINAPYILGSLWNASAPPPVSSPAEQRWMIRTRAGHFIDIVEEPGLITIATATGQKIEMSEAGILLDTENTSVELTAEGVTVKAPRISLEGTSEINISAEIVTITGSIETNVESEGLCNVTAPLVQIN